MKKLIVILAIVLLPAAAWGWRDGYDSDRYYNDLDRNYQFRPRKLWRIMEQFFGQNSSAITNVLGSRVQGLVPHDLPNKLK